MARHIDQPGRHYRRTFAMSMESRDDDDEEDDDDSLLRDIAAAPAIALPVDLATLVLLQPGEIIDGNFVIEERLGAGGMGVVYAARDLKLGRRVAIKLMRLERTVGGLGRKLPEVFEREAQATAALNHPNIVTLHQFGNWNGVLYLVLERLDGEALSARLERGTLTLLEALAIVEGVAAALVHTHARGIVHRDLKPQNVFLLTDGTVKVLDFGVSGIGRAVAAPTESTDGRATLSLAGTPGYMAPEQWLGEQQDARTDIWAVGVIAFQLATGTLPFGVTVATAPPELSAVPGELAPIITRCLVLRREGRYDASELVAAVRTLRADLDPTLSPSVGPRSLASRILRPALAVLAIGGLAIGARVLSRDRSGVCDATDRMAGIWDGPSRMQLAARFSGHDAVTWNAIAAAVDRYVEEWVALAERSCRSEDEVAAACLDERRAQLARYLRETTTLNSWSLDGARQLPPVSDCGDRGYLARWTAGTDATARTDRGLVRAAWFVHSPSKDVIHGALPLAGTQSMVVAGASGPGGTFVDRKIPIAGAFVARVDRDAHVSWFHPSQGAKVISLAAAGPRAFFVAGIYTGETVLAGAKLSAPPGTEDCFAGKLDAATGEAQWIVPCAATESSASRGAAGDRDGNLYIVGDFGGRATFGGTTAVDAAARPNRAPFVASWSSSGSLRWVMAGHGTGSSMSKGIAADGDLVVIGAQVTGVGWLADHEIVAGGCIVAALDRARGTVVWLRELRITGCDLQGVAIHGDRVAAYGRIRRRGMFVMDLSATDGADRWSARFGTNDGEYVRSATYGDDGTLTIVGRISQPTMTLGSFTLQGHGATDAFVASFAPDGKVLGALAIGGANDDHLRWIQRRPDGHFLVAGHFGGGMLLGTREFQSSGDMDGLLLELALPWF